MWTSPTRRAVPERKDPAVSPVRDRERLRLPPAWGLQPPWWVSGYRLNKSRTQDKELQQGFASGWVGSPPSACEPKLATLIVYLPERRDDRWRMKKNDYWTTVEPWLAWVRNSYWWISIAARPSPERTTRPRAT